MPGLGLRFRRPGRPAGRHAHRHDRRPAVPAAGLAAHCAESGGLRAVGTGEESFLQKTSNQLGLFSFFWQKFYESFVSFETRKTWKRRVSNTVGMYTSMAYCTYPEYIISVTSRGPWVFFSKQPAMEWAQPVCNPSPNHRRKGETMRNLGSVQ